MHTYTHAYLYTMHTYTPCISIHMYIPIHMCIPIHMYIPVCVHTYARAYLRMCIGMHM